MMHHDIEQGSDEWHSLRYGIPTASYAKMLIQADGKPSKQLQSYAEKLAGDRFAGKSLDSFSGNAATQRGNDLEPEARDYYRFARDVDVSECGFFTDNDERYGASPDGLVGNDGLLEIKCQEAKGHISTALQYRKTGKPPAAYIAQIQMQLLVCDRAWCDLVLYHPDLPSSIIRVDRDATLINSLIEQINAVIERRDFIIQQLKEIAA